MSDKYRLAERLEFMQIDQDMRRTLVELKPIIQPALLSIVEKSYRHTEKYPEVRDKFSNSGMIDAAKKTQTSHCSSILDARFDQNYVNQIVKVGQVHHRIGLETCWYIAGYAIILSELTAFLPVQSVYRDTGGR